MRSVSLGNVLPTAAMIVALGALSSVAAEQVPPPPDAPSLTLSIDMPKLCALGKRMPFRLILESQKDQEVATLDTACLQYELARYSLDRKERILCDGHLDDGVVTFVRKLPAGKEFTTWGPGRKPEVVTLERGKRLERRLVLQDVFFGRFKEPDDYVLTVTYEGKVKAEVCFTIVLEYGESVPALIDLIERAGFDTRWWARNTLWIITGQPSWRPAKDDDPQVVQARTRELRAWWRDNHELFERINRIYVPRKPDLPAAEARPDAPDASRRPR